MSKSIRIRTTPGGDEKYVKVNLEQNFDFIEILSLKLTQEEVYKTFASDYGVVVGRVIVNNGFGVPNAKVSIFIPIDDEDKKDPEKFSFYPYKTTSDKNSDGLRYNLLPKKETRPCHNPLGSFPNKREILDNDLILEVYEKYYKFTTTTNESGDYMLFGVPTGNHTLHMDVDLSDIGSISQRPYDFINKGYRGKQFDSPTKFNKDKNLDTLVHIKSQDIGVRVIPFWGDESISEIGITRVDVDLKYVVTPTAIFIGSIFGDNEKRSLNKNCRPRRAMGVIDEQTTSEGTIEMIRKDYNGKIERVDIDGGRVINDEGAWAYQIPMNLDYVITNEFGKLIPSNDPSKGIPTRSLCRFRISMDETGGEGRIRSRAKYLVPNNPNTFSDSDYEFSENTKNSSFAELRWNGLYTVKNFISRVQPSTNKNVKGFTGLKKLDDAGGDITPFPYNRLDSDLNPLFFVICLLLTIITLILQIINGFVIFMVNLLLEGLNILLGIVNGIIRGISNVICGAIDAIPFMSGDGCRRTFSKGELPKIDYAPCITVGCDDKKFAPGCTSGMKGYDRAVSIADGVTVIPAENIFQDGGFLLCMSIVLADALNVFSFEFYNDWVNGSLYAFLFKYKKVKNGKEKFCEYDCGTPEGVDGDGDGDYDNKCKGGGVFSDGNNYLLDRCVNGGISSEEYFPFKEGLIKNYKGELYYPSITKNGDYKMFATDIVSLGSVLDCDIYDIPVIHNRLLNTTYKLPPITPEEDDNEILVSGMAGSEPYIGGGNPIDGLLFTINCIGVNVNGVNCMNIKRICELGVGLDEKRDDLNLNCISVSADNLITDCDIDDLYVRDVFGWLNTSTINQLTPGGMSFTNQLYTDFRKKDSYTIQQPKGNSFYFYFGLKAGKTAIDLAKSKYFTTCKVSEVNEILILGEVTNVTTIGGSDGAIDISVSGGDEPYTITWTGPNGFTHTGEDLTGLEEGIYTVTVVDSSNMEVTRDFFVYEPQTLECLVSTKPASNVIASDGEIQVNSIIGGTAPFIVEIFNDSNLLIFTSSPISPPNTSLTHIVGVGDYSYVITDAVNDTCTGNVTVASPAALDVSVVVNDALCYNQASGKLIVTINSGNPPYLISVSGTSGFTSSSLTNLDSLLPDTYTINIQDSEQQTFGPLNYVINNATEITVTYSMTPITCYGGSDGAITLTVNGGTPPYSYSWFKNGNTPIGGNSNTLSSLYAGNYSYIATDSLGCEVPTYGINVSQPDPLVVRLAAQVSPTIAGNDGYISVFITGGNPGTVTYDLSLNGSPYTSNTTGYFSSLDVGTYSIIATDSEGCTGTMSNIILT